MLFGLIVVVLVFLVIQIANFSKLVNEEFGGIEQYMKKIHSVQTSPRLKAFKKNLFYQSLLLLAIIAFGLILQGL